MGSIGAFIKLFSQPTSPAEFVDRPPTYLEQINLRALAEAERLKQDEAGPSFRTVDPMADYEESQRVGAFNALQNIPNSPLGGAAALIPGVYEGLTRPVEGANPEVPNMLAAVDQMSLGGLIEGNVLGGVMRTKPAEPVGPPARLRGQPTLGGLATADPFYSQVRTVLEDPKTQGTQTGEAWSRFLSDPKRSVKAEEMQYTGLRDLLKAKAGERVTKEEITSHLDANEIEVKEVTKGAPRVVKPETQAMMDRNREISTELAPLRAEWRRLADRVPLDAKGFFVETSPEYAESEASMKPIKTLVKEQNQNEKLIQQHQAEADFKAKTKFSQYTLPGAENYREVLLQLPTKQRTDVRYSIKGKDGRLVPEPRAQTRAEAIEYAGGDPTRVTEISEKADTVNFSSGHWDEPNVLAHLRLSDRTVGGKRTLLVEEIQSDWAQKGRKEGFGPADDKMPPLEAKARGDGLWDIVRTDTGQRLSRQLAETAEEALATYTSLRDPSYVKGQVPAGPFVTDTSKWTALSLKRVLKMAADEGYDRIGIVPGVEQAKRYDLSKQVDSVTVAKSVHDENLYFVIGKKGGQQVYGSGAIPKDKIADMVGKDLAEKAVTDLDRMSKEPGAKEYKGVDYSGVDLQVGGEGMKGYYDKIVPDTLNKLAKEYGVKVQIEGGKVKPNPAKGADFWIDKDADGTFAIYDSADDTGPPIAEGFKTKDEAEKHMQTLDLDSVPIHTLDIPEPMKKNIKAKGFPLYSSLQGKTLGDLANA